MAIISRVKAREILDSRGNPTIEVDVFLANTMGRFAVPSGASTGEHEAIELRDGDPNRFAGKGVRKAVANVEQLIAAALVGKDASDQQAIDDMLIRLDGTSNKSRLGANAILGVSIATALAEAQSYQLSLYQYLNRSDVKHLPVPLMNILNGGSHANNGVDIQEFMIVPYGADRFSDALRWGAEIFYCLKDLLQSRGLSTAVGDEGGFAPQINSAEHALDLIMKSITMAGFTSTNIGIAIDAAASELYHGGAYQVRDRGVLSSLAFIEWWESLSTQYPIVSIEDGLDQNDWEGWKILTQRLGQKLQLVGDDLFVTHPAFIERGIAEGVANAVLIKPNQIGTLSQTLQAIKLAQANGYCTILSHRSGETEDTTIADLAVGVGASQIKTGSLSRSERTAKYNRLLRIEEELGDNARYFGRDAFEKWLKK